MSFLDKQIVPQYTMTNGNFMTTNSKDVCMNQCASCITVCHDKCKTKWTQLHEYWITKLEYLKIAIDVCQYNVQALYPTCPWTVLAAHRKL